MFLHVVGHNQRFSCIKMTFRRSTETISRNFQEVLYAIEELRNELIVEPSSGVPPKILHSRRWYPFFKVCQNRNSSHVKLLDVHKCLLSHTYVGLCRSNWWNTCFGHCSWEAQGCFSWEEAHHYPECFSCSRFWPKVHICFGRLGGLCTWCQNIDRCPTKAKWSKGSSRYYNLTLNSIVQNHRQKCLEPDILYLTIGRQILLGRCWICLQAWIPTTL